jgi:hypothetical protein
MPTWFRHQLPAPGVQLPAPGAHGADHARRVRGLRLRTRRVNGKPEHVHPLVNLPPTVAISHLVNSLKGVSSRRLRQQFPTCAGTTGGPSGCGPGPASPARPTARPTPPCATTSSSRKAPPDQAEARPPSLPARPSGRPVRLPGSTRVRGTRAGPRPRPPGRPRPAFQPPHQGHARAGSRPAERPTGSRWPGPAGAGRAGGRSRTAPGWR